MERRRVVVSGIVQGVFYRATAARRAHNLGPSGWVRNLPDGRVEAEIQGDAEQVGAMIAWMEQGPPRARVAAVRTQPLPVVDGETGFGDG